MALANVVLANFKKNFLFVVLCCVVLCCVVLCCVVLCCVPAKCHQNIPQLHTKL